MDTKWETCFRFAELMLQRRGFGNKTLVESENETKAFTFSKGKDKVFVWYFCYEKMNIDSIKEFIRLLEFHEIVHGIIVYQNTITASSRKVIENLFQFNIELFELKEMQYDITMFRYFCPHEKLDAVQTAEMRKKFGTSLPSLLRTDPIVRYYHFQKGDVIRVTRRNGTQIYRLVK